MPGSIDNDIYCTRLSNGVDTRSHIPRRDRQVRDTASSHERCFLLEVMGRNSGYLATIGGIMGGAEFVIVPERAMTLEEVGQALEDAYMRGKSHAMGVIAEGATLKINEIAEYLENHEVGFEVRMTVLGHMMRGGAIRIRRLLATAGVAAPSVCGRRVSVMVGLRRDVARCRWKTLPEGDIRSEEIRMAEMLAK